MSTSAEGNATYKVVVNSLHQFSLWPARKQNPLGWSDAGKNGVESECLAFIEEQWLGASAKQMGRTPEQELMLDEEQAAAYSDADLSELHEPMLACFRNRFPAFEGKHILDLGCGSADMTIRFARTYPDTSLFGIDGSDAMLARGRSAVARTNLQDRIVLENHHIPDESLGARHFDAVISNSLLHHLQDPSSLWQTICRCAKSGVPVMVMDLRRPVSMAAAERLVTRYGAEAHPAVRRDFLNSLCAAYTAAEIRNQLDECGLSAFHVEELGDLHLIIWGAAPSQFD